jgi:malate dehydrogenase
VFLDGEYGVRGQFLGVPVVIGKGGAERVIEIRLGVDEQAALMKSAAAVRELTEIIGV